MRDTRTHLPLERLWIYDYVELEQRARVTATLQERKPPLSTQAVSSTASIDPDSTDLDANCHHVDVNCTSRPQLSIFYGTDGGYCVGVVVGLDLLHPIASVI